MASSQMLRGGALVLWSAWLVTGCELLAGIDDQRQLSSTGAPLAGGGGVGGGHAGQGGTGDGGAGGQGGIGGAGGGGGVIDPCPPGSGPGCVVWLRQFGDASTDVARELAVDSLGNVFVAGIFGGALPPCPGNTPIAPEGDDLFLAKLDPQGTPLWCKGFGSLASQNPYGGLAVDGAGNVILAGDLQGTTHFGASGSCGSHPGTGRDAFAAKFDPDGNCLWVQSWGDDSEQIARSVAVDSSGNIIVVGYFSGDIAFEDFEFSSLGGPDIFVAKLRPGNGTAIWAKTFGAGFQDYAGAVAVDGLDHIVVVGNAAGSFDFGGPIVGAMGGGQDVVIAKLNADGDHMWSRAFGEAQEQTGKAVAIGPDGEVYFSGYADGPINIDGNELTPSGRSGYLGKLNAQGGAVDSALFECTVNSPTLAVDLGGNVIAGFTHSTTCNMGAGLSFPHHGDMDSILLSLNDQLEPQWGFHVAGAGNQFLFAIGRDPAGHLLAAGGFSSSVDFGGNVLDTVGGSDGFVVKLTP